MYAESSSHLDWFHCFHPDPGTFPLLLPLGSGIESFCYTWPWTLDRTGPTVCGPRLARETADGAPVQCLDATQPYDPRPAYFMRETVDVIVTRQILADSRDPRLHQALWSAARGLREKRRTGP